MFTAFSTIRKIGSTSNFISVAKALQLKASDQEIELMGWLKNQRSYKRMTFLDIDDGSTFKRIQVIVPKNICPKNLKFHTCISVKGKLVNSPGVDQDVELVAEKVEVLSSGAPAEYPFFEKGTYLQEDLRQVPHFRSRVRDFSSLLRVRSQAKMFIHDYFAKEDFVNIDTPILTTNNSEGGGEVFAVKGQGIMKHHETGVEVGDAVFGQPVYLSVSGQLHLEAMANGLSKVYNFNPAFRGEKGSRFHLHEFWMVEMEEAFLEGREGYASLIKRLEAFIKFVLDHVLSHSGDDIQYLWKFNRKEEILKQLIPKVVEKPFIKLQFREALKILEENKSKLKSPPRISSDSVSDINREGEIFLTKHFDDSPVFLTDFPAASKPFYMYTDKEDDKELACGVDLLLPFIGEVAGGGVREHRLHVLKKKIETLRSKEDLKWYLQLREFGYAPSGGFGLGFERLLQFLLGIDNIRDTISFPRANGQCVC